MKTISINPAIDIFYHSFYVQGLREICGARNITYSRQKLPQAGEHGCALIVHDKSDHKIYIAAEDSPEINLEALEWCDIYAKINVSPDVMPAQGASKIMPIGPSFAVKIYAPPHALYHALKTYHLTKKQPKQHFMNYYRQLKHRFPESFYKPGVTQRDYIFFSGTIWKKDTGTNDARSLFVEACKSTPGVRFEGGFRPRSKNDVPGYEHLTDYTEYSHADYIHKTQASAVVFNTPAVMRCHGWKLGEFLAMGKAIVSTPPEWLLPAPLVHGEHIHYVENSAESIREAVALICRDDDYRKQLEQGARQYYDQYLKPAAVVGRILKAASGNLETSH